jgi:mono/diheme cytochrome c family protein
MNFKVSAGVAAVAVIGGALMVSTPRSAEATPAYSAQTGRACGACHQNPGGGGARTALGNAFAANGHKLPGKKSK